MSEAVNNYIRSQGTGAAVGNMVINPALAWVINRRMGYVPDSEVIIDTAITCVVMALIVALITAKGTRREFDAGRITSSDASHVAGSLLSWLPRTGWALGLMLGLGAAVVIAPLTWVLFTLLGVAALPLVGFALFKAAWTPLLAIAIVRWVVLRQLLPVPAA